MIRILLLILLCFSASAAQTSLPHRRAHHQPAAGGGGGSSIAVDDTTVARWANAVGTGTAVTSASFTPANNSLLVCCVSADTDSGVSITITVSGGSLTWTARTERNAAESGANGGYAGIFTAPVATGANMTCSVTRTVNGAGSKRISAKLYIVTGQNASNPIGTVGEGSSAVNNLSASAYTSTVNNSRAFGAATDWSALGAGTTAPTSSDTGSGATYSGQIDALSVYKAANTASSGTAVTLNFDASGTGTPAWNWCALEIVP